MATPVMQLNTTTIPLVIGSGGSVLFPTKSPSGTTIDVSSGYTLENLLMVPSSNRNTDAASIDLSSHGSVSFGTTGVTFSWTSAQSIALSTSLQVLNWNYILQITNDSGATLAMIGQGNVNVNNAYGLQ